MDGGSILDKMKKQSKPLNEEQIAYVVHEVLLGLDYLSRAHKIHRDIKAANSQWTNAGTGGDAFGENQHGTPRTRADLAIVRLSLRSLQSCCRGPAK